MTEATAWDRLYQAAERCAALGLALESALEAVHGGYSSVAADEMVREDP